MEGMENAESVEGPPTNPKTVTKANMGLPYPRYVTVWK